ncbi:biotin-dependent carboxyltransferase family protein [Paenibacillus alkaliterrae]|uniref:5-oxoprolinase subunit C family protein n=1 Tax=Paenibacillus alkaliterrae TaxID=320909 RepID=UPI001F30F584|nr:biotin-dependent carboxyltransferase family protein [Paenibacillus alkaliterrae]MCF2940526.1 biotin-dependent carboxyltransferase family protein [Paenibacillus alkaliterrae]
MSINVIKSGLFATVQDLGRHGSQKYGVSVGGVMDTGAARAANLLVGNKESEAVIEMTLAGTELWLEKDTLIAVCGADITATAGGERLPLWRPVLVREGVTVTFGVCRSGCRTYVAVAGGLDVPDLLGSKSTYLRGAFGGFEGRALKTGDVLRVKNEGQLSDRIKQSLLAKGNGSFAAAGWHASHFAIAAHLSDPVIRVLTGSHYPLFTVESQQSLFSQTFQISVQSDRMGCRLEGSRKLKLSSPVELLSEAVAVGTVQVPPDGNPIVLLADRQTTGGYPRIANVASVDIPVFAQLKPGDRFRFEAITQQEAEQLLVESERDIQILKAAVSLKF